MLLDRHLARYDHRVLRHVVIEASAEEAYHALGTADLGDPLVRMLYDVSQLPQRVRMRLQGKDPPPAPERLTVKELGWRKKFAVLDEHPGVETVSGGIIRVRPEGLRRVRALGIVPMPATDFDGFEAPGHVKIASSFLIREHGAHRSLVVQEVRARGTDRRVSRALRFVWPPLASGLAVVMEHMLERVRQEAERPHPPPGQVSATAGEPTATRR